MSKAFLIIIFLLGFSLEALADSRKEYLFASGPDGGVFRVFASSISEYLSNNQDSKTFTTFPSGGSVENLKLVEGRRVDFGVVYSGDLYLATEGRLERRVRYYGNVMAASYLYSSTAQLVAKKDSDLNSVQDLIGKRVAVGAKGSGASAAAKRFFESMGLWRKVKPMFLGYSAGADALTLGQVDALWLFTGYPNPAVNFLSNTIDLKMLQIYDEAKEQGVLFEDYPFYTKALIPAGIYKGIDYDVVTIADSTLLVAGKHVPQNVVEESLDLIYTPVGLSYLVSKKSTAKSMNIDSGINGIVTPLHKGAQVFWEKQGKTLTEDQASNEIR
jgi:TRAP transporter TAXI family solute receptor